VEKYYWQVSIKNAATGDMVELCRGETSGEIANLVRAMCDMSHAPTQIVIEKRVDTTLPKPGF